MAAGMQTAGISPSDRIKVVECPTKKPRDEVPLESATAASAGEQEGPSVEPGEEAAAAQSRNAGCRDRRESHIPLHGRWGTGDA